MKTELLFVDDSDATATTGVLALTGILVDVAQYDTVRTAFYRSVQDLFPCGPNEIDMGPPEYHGSDLFKKVPDATDAHRVQAHRDVVELCNRFELDILRVGYSNAVAIDRFASPGCAATMCWVGMVEMLQDRLEGGAIIPIMDRCKDRAAASISGSMRNATLLRMARPDAMTWRNTENILGEVFYADSTFSPLVQIADMIGYMLHACDCVARSIATDYKRSIAGARTELKDARIRDSVLAMTFDKDGMTSEKG